MNGVVNPTPQSSLVLASLGESLVETCVEQPGEPEREEASNLSESSLLTFVDPKFDDGDVGTLEGKRGLGAIAGFIRGFDADLECFI